MKRFFAFALVAAMATPLFAADGAAVYKAKCAGCHGADGSKSIPAMGVKPLNTAEVKGKSEAALADIVLKGPGLTARRSRSSSPPTARTWRQNCHSATWR